MEPDGLVDQPIAWQRTTDGEYPYQATHDGVTLIVRVNDFPAEPLYTLLVDYRPVLDLDDWPAAWQRPPTPPELLRVGGEAQAGRGRFDAIAAADWAQRLDTAPAGPVERVLAELGLPPTPPGIERLDVSERDGVVTALEVIPAGGGPTVGELDELLGPGIESVRVHWDSPRPYRYEVGTCFLFAYFTDGPASIRLLYQRHLSAG